MMIASHKFWFLISQRSLAHREKWTMVKALEV